MRASIHTPTTAHYPPLDLSLSLFRMTPRRHVTPAWFAAVSTHAQRGCSWRHSWRPTAAWHRVASMRALAAPRGERASSGARRRGARAAVPAAVHRTFSLAQLARHLLVNACSKQAGRKLRPEQALALSLTTAGSTPPTQQVRVPAARLVDATPAAARSPHRDSPPRRRRHCRRLQCEEPSPTLSSLPNCAPQQWPPTPWRCARAPATRR